jgi:hypothetical protein
MGVTFDEQDPLATRGHVPAGFNAKPTGITALLLKSGIVKTQMGANIAMGCISAFCVLTTLALIFF